MNMYDLQARCEQIAADARKAQHYRARLARAEKRFRALAASLADERAAHKETQGELACVRRMAGAMARRINGRS